MRRLALSVFACLLLLSGIAAWSFGGTVTAEDDDLAALQTQVAEIDARVAALEGTPRAAASPQSVTVLNFTGPSSGVTEGFRLDAGSYTVTFTCADPAGVATIIGAPANLDTLIPGKSVLTIPPGSYRLDVRCGDAWSIVLVSRSH